MLLRSLKYLLQNSVILNLRICIHMLGETY
nr:MAG TPA: hypothetical protein [Caudoviricetes sp.]